MFEQSFVPHAKANPVPIALACLSEAMLLTSLAVLPLLFVDSLPEQALFKVLMLPAVPAAPPSPPPPMLASQPIRTATRAIRGFDPQSSGNPRLANFRSRLIWHFSNSQPAIFRGLAGQIESGR